MRLSEHHLLRRAQAVRKRLLYYPMRVGPIFQYRTSMLPTLGDTLKP